MILFLDSVKRVFVPKKHKQNTSLRKLNTCLFKTTNKIALLAL